LRLAGLPRHHPGAAEAEAGGRVDEAREGDIEAEEIAGEAQADGLEAQDHGIEAQDRDIEAQDHDSEAHEGRRQEARQDDFQDYYQERRDEAREEIAGALEVRSQPAEGRGTAAEISLISPGS
jgi:hypothetical protein